MPITSDQAPGRQARSVRNDARILEAAVDILDTQGWGGLSISHAAERAGLNGSTVTSRHPNRSSLGRQAWADALGPDLTKALTHAVAALGSGDVSGGDLASAFAPFLKPGTHLRGASELLIVAGYDPVLKQAVSADFGAWLTEAVTPRRGVVSRTLAAQRSIITALAIGLILEARRVGKLAADFTDFFDAMARAIAHPSAPTRLPTAGGEFLDARIDFGTGERSWDAALQATLDCVGELGYEAATIETIAASSGFSRTVIFSRYASKQELFMDASNRMLSAAVNAGQAYQSAIAKRHTPGIAETCYVREVMRPKRYRVRTITLEQVRIAAHDPAMKSAVASALKSLEAQYGQAHPTATSKQVRARIIGEIALTTGLGLLAQLDDQVWDLSYDTFFVPWLAREW